MKRNGFTLLETLLVIVMLAVLAVLLFSIQQKVLGAANQTKCMANLKQIGAAVALYATDHNGKLPLPYSTNYPNSGNANGVDGNPAMQGFPALLPYLAPGGTRLDVIKIFFCPSSKRPFPEVLDAWINRAVIPSSYNQYCGWGPTGGNSGFFLNSRDYIRQREKSPLLFIDFTTRDLPLQSNHRRSNETASGANALYVDGSVAWLSVEKLTFSITRLGVTYLFPDPYQ